MADGPKTLLNKLIDDTWRVDSKAKSADWFADTWLHGGTTEDGFDLVPVDIWSIIHSLVGEVGRADVPHHTKIVMIRAIRSAAQYAEKSVPEGTVEEIRQLSAW